MSYELLPCPFCGGDAEYDNSDHGPYEWIYCIKCGAHGPETRYGDPEDCRALWNERSERSR
jgi:hypothetical protein